MKEAEQEKYEIFFIDPDGKRYAGENITSHIQLTGLILNQHPKMKEEFEKSGEFTPSVFLIKKGYIQSIVMGDWKAIAFDSTKMTDIQKKIIEKYKERGYELIDEAKEEQENQCTNEDAR